MLDELLSHALVGTAHSVGDTATLPEQLQEAANTLECVSAEQALLSRVAFLDAYLRCGIRPAVGVRLPDVAEDEDLFCCSCRSADLLADLLRDREKLMVAEWISFASNAKKRAPYRLLPDLLDFAVKEKSLRDAVTKVAGRRGRWLMAQNADWAFAAQDGISDQEQWETGNPPLRLLIMRQARETDPSQARELLQKNLEG